MDYRYLETTGALNQSGPWQASGGRLSASTWKDRERGGGEPPLWRGKPVARALCEFMPESVARECVVFPIGEEGETLLLAATDPNDIESLDKLTFLLGRPIQFVRASREEVESLIRAYYAGPTRTETVDSMLHGFADAAVPRPAIPPRSRRITSLAESAAPSWAATGSRISRTVPRKGIDPAHPIGDTGVWFYVVEEGQRVLMRYPDGTMEVIEGPRRVWRGRRRFQSMVHHVAHPGDYLIVRYRDGRQEHFPGPAEVWFDPRVHQEVLGEEMLQVPARNAVVVYSQKEGTNSVQRRIEYGPTMFMPRPGEWLHRFVWHASEEGPHGVTKIPNGLVFHKLWLMPDQMYHDVTDVRTADDAVLTIRLMIFFELQDIDRMLETTHDPIGDFVNAATSDVVDFIGRHDFESFKRHTDRLNELETYRQLASRAAQCGYRINKVVYRGYGAPDRLQQMHDQAIEARTRLQLERATEQQAQELENYKLESRMLRAGKRRQEQTAEVAHQLELDHQKLGAELSTREAQAAFQREQQRLDGVSRVEHRIRQDQHLREHLGELHRLGVDLTAYLTQNRADRVIELRGPQGGAAHLHLDPSHVSDDARSRPDGAGNSAVGPL